MRESPKLPKKTRNYEKFQDEERALLPDNVLMWRFEILLDRCWYFGRSDDILIKYINELEFRNLKYSLKPWRTFDSK